MQGGSALQWAGEGGRGSGSKPAVRLAARDPVRSLLTLQQDGGSQRFQRQGSEGASALGSSRGGCRHQGDLMFQRVSGRPGFPGGDLLRQRETGEKRKKKYARQRKKAANFKGPNLRPAFVRHTSASEWVDEARRLWAVGKHAMTEEVVPYSDPKRNLVRTRRGSTSAPFCWVPSALTTLATPAVGTLHSPRPNGGNVQNVQSRTAG